VVELVENIIDNKIRSNSNSINLVGEFYAMSRLFLEGYEASLTLGNTKGVDILLFNPKNNKQFRVEVKTSSSILNEKTFGGKNIRWFMNKKHEELNDDSLVFCFIFVDKKEKSYKIFFVPSKEVAEYCKWENKHWIEAEHKKPIDETGQMRSFRIKLDESSKWENNFSFFD